MVITIVGSSFCLGSRWFSFSFIDSTGEDAIIESKGSLSWYVVYAVGYYGGRSDQLGYRASIRYLCVYFRF